MQRVQLKLFRGWFYAYWRDETGTRRRALRTQDRATAQRLLIDLQRQPLGGTVTDAMAAYLADKDQSATAPQRLHDAWKALKPHFGHLRPDQVTRDACRDYANTRRSAKRSDGTIRKELSTLRAALKWADKSTPAVIELPSAPPPKDRYLTRAEFSKLREAAEAFHVELFIVLALATAGRKEAVLELTWDRVDFERGLIQLGTGEGLRKGRATVPMSGTAREMLIKAKEAALTEFVIEWGGKRVSNCRRGFEQAAQRSGLKDVTPHVLRHTAAVWMAEAGIPMPEIAQYLGHSDSRITERVYGRYSPEYLRKAMSALEI
ncbi:MAG: site-specific integrase [Rhodospirillaceae bacterium]|nr:site-specific integrase [Rhodospirillaceae bacterium]